MGFTTKGDEAPVEYGDGRLERVSNGAREYPVDNVEYISPNQVGSTQIKRIYFNRSSTGYVNTSGLTEIKGSSIQLLTFNDNQNMWGYLATNNGNRWWYVRVEPANNRIRVDIASEILGCRGWVDYI